MDSLNGGIYGALNVLAADVFEGRTFSAGLAFDSVTRGVEKAPSNFADTAEVIHSQMQGTPVYSKGVAVTDGFGMT